MSVRLLLLLLLALPAASAASAQELPPPPLVSAPEDDEAPAPPPREDPSAPAETPVEQAPPEGQVFPRAHAPGALDSRLAPRVGLELLGGTVGGLVGGGAGFLLGLTLGSATVGCGSYECLVTGFVGGVAGVLLGVPSGAYAAGRLLDGRGAFSAAVVGSLVGSGATALGLVLLANSPVMSPEPFIAALLLLPVVGASLGLELSHAGRRTLVPVAGLTAGGLRLGLAGHF